MDFVKAPDLLKNLVTAGKVKSELSVKDIFLRGSLSGALLGVATTLAITAATQTNTPLVGAIIFPVGFVMIVVLGLELVTGSFAIVPLAAVDGRTPWSRVISNLCLVFLANLVGSVAYGLLYYVTVTNFGTDTASGIAPKIVAAAEAKTLAYAAHGWAGMGTAIVKGILCNWLVCLGAVMAFTSHSTFGKIAAAWLPITTFFAQGFEHSVVNMFLIPTGMLLGAKVNVTQWWLWNQLPVTLGNMIGGLIFTGLFLYWTYKPARSAASTTASETMTAIDTAVDPVRA
ncbi:MAG TPA: formate/nitrite transporter family protein [Opitutaceae bacterium]